MCYEIFIILIVFIVGLAVIDKLDDDLKQYLIGGYK